ncbi:MAG: coproporphyrinogen III oxidase, partial [Gemmatimonadetes bacterium]|nr:coproporphyrinogen III oxidase [Gemmatimonadota bacterium]
GLPYLGLGPAPHSFLEDAAGPLRRWNLPDLEGWIGALEAGIVPPRGEERPTPSQRLLERLMLGLRTREGVDLAAARSELGDAAVEAVLARAAGPAATGLLRHRSGRLRPTLRGLAVADRLALDLA